MEIFVKEYLNKQGIKTVEGLAQHIIELKRNTVVPDIVFDLVDVLVNDKDCLLSFFGENNKVDTVSNRDFVGYQWINPDYYKYVPSTPQMEKLKPIRIDEDKIFEEWEMTCKQYLEWLKSVEKNAINKARQEKVKTVLDDVISTSPFYKRQLNYQKNNRVESKDDTIFNSNRAEKDTMEFLKAGIKETDGKLDYSEINLEILDLMSERFTANKHKYPQGNMKKPMDIKKLEWALFRHVKKMVQPIQNDEETYEQHLASSLCNLSMILDQLKLNKS